MAERAGINPLVTRRMRDHLSELIMLGILDVTERNEGRRGGTYREYSVSMDPELIISAMADTVELVGIHESIEKLLERESTSTLQDYQ